jgi:hypothetical protein
MAEAECSGILDPSIDADRQKAAAFLGRMAGNSRHNPSAIRIRFDEARYAHALLESAERAEKKGEALVHDPRDLVFVARFAYKKAAILTELAEGHSELAET